MKIGIVPTLYGYSAVVLPPYKGKWEFLSPVPLAHDMIVQLRGQILQALATFAYSMSPWTGMLKVALFWALWGGGALYLRLNRYLEMGWAFIILYGWIMFLFFGDGLFQLGRNLYQIPNLMRAKSIRNKAAEGEWVVLDKTMPLRPIYLDQAYTEKEYVEAVAEDYPKTRPFYDEMLTKEDPMLFRFWPLGLLELVRFLFIGPRIPPPHIIIELGDLR